MASSEASRKAAIKYRKANRAQIVIDVSKAQRMQINDYCRPYGGTGSYLKYLLRSDMIKNGVRPLEPSEEYIPQDRAED